MPLPPGLPLPLPLGLPLPPAFPFPLTGVSAFGASFFGVAGAAACESPPPPCGWAGVEC